MSLMEFTNDILNSNSIADKNNVNAVDLTAKFTKYAAEWQDSTNTDLYLDTASIVSINTGMSATNVIGSSFTTLYGDGSNLTGIPTVTFSEVHDYSGTFLPYELTIDDNIPAIGDVYAFYSRSISYTPAKNTTTLVIDVDMSIGLDPPTIPSTTEFYLLLYDQDDTLVGMSIANTPSTTAPVLDLTFTLRSFVTVSNLDEKTFSLYCARGSDQVWSVSNNGFGGKRLSTHFTIEELEI